MLNLLREKDFLKLWTANIVASFGGQALSLALSVYVFQLTQSALASGAMLLASTLPGLLLGSIGGTYADRLERRRLMVWVNVLWAALVGSLALVPQLESKGLESLWWVYAVAFLQSALMQFFGPAEQALIPQLVPQNKLLEANSANMVAGQVVRLIAPALGGTLVALYGLGWVAALGAAGFLLSSLLIALLVYRPSAPARASRTAPFKLAVREGLLEVRRNSTARALLVVSGLDSLKEGALSALFAAFTLGVLGASAPQMGLVNSIQAIGGLLAGALVPTLVARFQPRAVIAVGLALNGLCLWGMATFPSLALTLALFCVTGIPVTAAYVTAGTLLQQSVTDERRGRVFGLQSVAGSLGFLLSALSGSLLGDAFGVARVLSIFVLFDVLAALVAWRTLEPTRSPHILPRPKALK